MSYTKIAHTMNELEEEQRAAREDFVKYCPHIDIIVEDTHFGNRRDITLRCSRCRENLVGYCIDGRSQSYLAYVRECVQKYPGNMRRSSKDDLH